VFQERTDERLAAVLDDAHKRSVAALMRRFRIPGLALTVIDGGAIVHESGHGTLRVSGEAPVTMTTPFQACSISKPVVALATLRLVDRGDLDLDADVNDLLTSWRLPANGTWQPRVTLRQLVSHTAGLTTGGFPGYRRDAARPTLPQVLSGVAPANTEGVRVDLLPRLHFRYSGGGTTVEQQVLEDVTGVPLADLVRSLVLEPLGMDDSDYSRPLPAAWHDRVAIGHREDGTEVPGGWMVYPEQAAAGLWTTPSDLCRYAIGVQRARAGTAGALLSLALAAEMLSPVAPTGFWDLEHIGLGPFLGGSGATLRFGHGGSNDGYRCQLVAYAHTGQGAAVMTNSDNGRVCCFGVLDAVAEAMGWPDWPGVREEWEVPGDDLIARAVGVHRLPSRASIDVGRDGYDLLVTLPRQAPARFRFSEDRTFVSNVVDARLVVGDGAGHDGITIEQAGSSVVCTRLG
jgi:CubicO group peptidase (beta-lactamase class C family)